MKFYAALLGALSFMGCMSTVPAYFTETAIRDGDLPAKGVALVGLSLWFDGIPEELVWNIELRMKDVESQKIVNFTAKGQDFVLGKSQDRAPVVFSVPSGKYQPEAIVLKFPKEENTLYTMEQETLTLTPTTPLSSADTAAGWMLYVGEVKIGRADFVVGKSSHATKMSASWNPAGPVMGTTWQRVREQVRVADLGNYPVSGAPKQGMVPALLMFEKTTDGAFSALKSGFSDSYGIVLVKATEPGFAFFEDAVGNLFRVQSKPYGKSQYFALAVGPSDRMSMRGFCFNAEENVEQCPRESLREEPLFTRGDFTPGEIRFRGSYSRSGGSLAMSPLLDEATALEVDKEIPGAVFHSFVLADEPCKRKASGVVLFDSNGTRSTWDAASQIFADKILAKATECDALLRGVDPLVSATWEIFWEPGSDGKMAIRDKSIKGIGAAASKVLRSCLEPEVGQWKDYDKTEIGKGFGIRFR